MNGNGIQQKPRILPSERTKSTVLTLFLINVSYVVFSTPMILEHIKIEHPELFDEETGNLLSILIEISIPINHSINILLYCASGEKFRKHLKDIICLRSSENAVKGLSTTKTS